MAKQIVNKDGIVTPVGTIEDFRRPNHTDFATGAELREQKWSGIRHNSLNDDCEVWLEGHVMERVTAAAIAINPQAINEAVERVFSLHEVQPDIPQLRAHRDATSGKA